MRCEDAAVLLNSLQVSASPGATSGVDPGLVGFLDELVRRGFVETFTDGNGAAAELADKKAALGEALASAQSGRPAEALIPGALTVMPEAAEGIEPALESRIATLRSEVLDLSERAARTEGSVEVAGKRYALTYRGRTLLSTLMTRLNRVGASDLATFEAELEALKKSFDARAKKGAGIFRDLKAQHKDLDESGLRVAAVGLAAREESERALGNAYESAVKSLKAAGVAKERIPTLAECLVLAGFWRSQPMAVEVESLMALSRTLSQALAADYTQDTLSAAALLMPFDPSKRQVLIDDAVRFKGALETAGGFRAESLSAFVLFAAAGLTGQQAAQDWILRMRAEIIGRGATHAEAEMATAILSASKVESGVELAFQFDVARSYLSRLSSGGMVVPAAMVAVLGTGVEESLDDLRLASTAVTSNGLSPGGMESLSLGLKVLMQTAVLASAPTSAGYALKLGPTDAAVMATFGLPGLTLVLPVALTAFAAFHELSIHRFSTSEYAYHPVHTHYIYG